MFPPSWHLTANPFATPQAPGCFYTGAAQQEAFARLRYLVDGGRRLGSLAGAPGWGKTTLLEQFAREQSRLQRSATLVHAGGLSPRELLWQLSADLSLGPREDDSSLRLLRRLSDFAVTSPLLVGQAVLLIDDADQAGPDLWSLLERLVHLAPRAAWLTIVVAGDFLGGDASTPRLLEAASLNVELERWTAEATAAAVRQTVEHAGGDKTILTDEACTQLHRITEGTPRLVYRYAEQALLAAAVEEASVVEARHVTQAAAEATLAMRSP